MPGVDYKTVQSRVPMTAGVSLAYSDRGRSGPRVKRSSNGLADCDTAIQLGPDRVNAYRGRAAVHVFRGDLALALADLDIAIRLDSTDAMTYRVRGNVHKRLGDSIFAEDDFAKAKDLGPGPE